MKAKKILAEEIRDLKISSLPTRPTASVAFGGKGYTSTELKEAFDKLPLFIIERYNALVEDILELGSGSLADSVMTGIREGHSLADMWADIQTGEFASYLIVDGESLASHIAQIKEELRILHEQNQS